MRHILRRRELVEDRWRYLGEVTGDAAEGNASGAEAGGYSGPLIVPFAEFRANLAKWRAHPGPLGVRMSPADRIEDLVEDLPRLALIAVEFPTPTDGRGYSHGRILGTRLDFKGELRAVGAVKQDQIFFMARCGYDTFELAAGEKVVEAASAMQRFTVAYQPADPRVTITRQRFFARGG